MIAECKYCSEKDYRIKSEKRVNPKSGSYFVYRNKNGERWKGLQCPQCSRHYSVGLNRKNGIGTIDKVKEPRMKKGRDAEKL